MSITNLEAALLAKCTIAFLDKEYLSKEVVQFMVSMTRREYGKMPSALYEHALRYRIPLVGVEREP